MKVAGLFFVAFIACASAAVPAPVDTKYDEVAMDSRNTRFVDGIIAEAIESVSQNIRDAGLDPFVLEEFDIGYALPVPVLFNGAAHAKNVQVTGISDILINNLNFALLTTRLTLDISLPQIVLNVDDAWFDLTVLGHQFFGSTSSRLAITNVGVRGSVRVNVGVISGISVRDIDLNLYLGGLQYNGYANLMGYDVTPIIDRIVHHELPATLNELHREINQMLEIIVTQVINDL